MPRARLYRLIEELSDEEVAGAARLLSDPTLRPLLRRLGSATAVPPVPAAPEPQPRPAPEAPPAADDEHAGIPFSMMDEVLFDFYFKDGGR